MKKSWLEFYGLAVCFTTIMCLIVCSSIMIRSLLVIAMPERSIPTHEYKRLHSNQAYWDEEVQRHQWQQEKNAILPPRPTEKELTQRRQEAKSLAIFVEQREGLNSLINACIVWFISGLILLIHIRIVRKERNIAF